MSMAQSVYLAYITLTFLYPSWSRAGESQIHLFLTLPAGDFAGMNSGISLLEVVPRLNRATTATTATSIEGSKYGEEDTDMRSVLTTD